MNDLTLLGLFQNYIPEQSLQRFPFPAQNTPVSI
jgi:hypothetical protein